jgi:hypothetical protein
MRVALACVLLAGCDIVFRVDRIHPVDGDGGTGDGGLTDGGGNGDARPDVPQSSACDTSAISQVFVGAFSGPSVTADQLQLFMTNLETNADKTLYVATRGSIGQPWSGAQLVSELASSGEDFEPAVWGQGLRLSFLSTRSGSRLLYQATRAQVTDSWATVTLIGTANPSFTGFDVTADGLTLYADDGLNNALSKATRTTETQSFGAFGTIYSGVGQPSLTGNQLVIYYHRGGSIYRAERPSTVSGFSGEKIVTTGSDPDVSDDGTRLYFRNAVGIASMPCQ